MPLGGTLAPDTRVVMFTPLMPSDEKEEAYAPQFSPTTGPPSKPVRLAFGALVIKQRLGLIDWGTVEQIREKQYLQLFLGSAGYSSKARFDPSMMVHFRKGQPSQRVAIHRDRSDQARRTDRRAR